MKRMLVWISALGMGAVAGDLRFQAGSGGEFAFDTGVLRGKLREGGKSRGLTQVVHVPSDTSMSGTYGLFSHYRVFTTNQRYGGGAWDWPSEAKVREDGAVEVHWPAAEGRPFDMWAVYRWTAPETLDLETRVKAHAGLPGFESFLASYFTAPFTSSRVSAKTGLLAAEQGEGVWQMFPRDEAALALIRDGRWKIPPNPVDWVLRPMLAEPLALRRDAKSGVTAVLMAPERDCFAVATPHQTEGHYSLYLSLFGRTLQAGETASARARLVVMASPGETEIQKRYEAYSRFVESH